LSAGITTQTKPLPATAERTGRPRVVFVTIGQAPRAEVVQDILCRLPMPVDHDEFGCLDDVDGAALAALAPGPGEHALCTRLCDGSNVIVKAAVIEERLAALVAEIDVMGYDLIVIATTGVFQSLKTTTPQLHGQRIVDAWVDALILAEQRIGVIYPLQRQIEEPRFIQGTPIQRLPTSALRDNDDGIARAARRCRDCDIVVMHSIAYSEATAREVARLKGCPVVTVRSILAGAIRYQLALIAGQPGFSPAEHERRLAHLMPELTPRERQVTAHVVNGASNKEIGRLLGISYRTVEIHRARAMEKFGVTTVSGLMRRVLLFGGRIGG